jgi:hypothetical protein
MGPPRSAIPGYSLLVAAIVVLLMFTGSIMAQECLLAGPLVVKDLQGGFVGQTGTIWTIAPDCSFTVARQIGTKVGDPYKRGRLSTEQQHRLKDLIGRIDFISLPGQLGGTPQPNARQITVSYGQVLSVLNLPPGGNADPLLLAARDKRAAELLELAHSLGDLLGG